MLKMAYTARTLTGEIVEGIARGRDEGEIRTSLSIKGLELLSATEAPESRMPNFAAFSVRFKGRVKRSEIFWFTGQLALMLETGSTIVDSLEALAEQTEDAKLRRILKSVSTDLQGGSTLAMAMGAHPNAFNTFYISAIKAGETSGNLVDVFNRLEAHMTRREELLSSIRVALAYPTILTILSFGAVVFLVTFVLPKFTEIFERNGAVLPLPTRMLLTSSEIVTTYWHFILLGGVCSAICAYAYANSETGRFRIDQIVLKLPVIGVLVNSIYTSSLLRILGTLLNAGVPMTESMNVARDTCSNNLYKTAVSNIMSGVLRGESFSENFSKSPLFSPSTKQMIATGDRTGSLPLVMNKMADYLDNDSEKQMKKLSALIEPLVIICMGVVVGFIAISVLLPLFRLTSAVKGAG